MTFILEALPAQHGDALLLHFENDKQKPALALIDAGPGGVLEDAVLPRLRAIHEERGEKRLFIEVGAVSHIDDDHVNGIEALTTGLVQNTIDVPIVFRRFWHNSFNDLIDDDDEELGTLKSNVNAASLHDSGSSAVVASVGQGRQVRLNLEALEIKRNMPFGTLIAAPHKKSPVTLGNATFTVVAPLLEQVEKLQQKWDKDLKALKKAKQGKAEVAEFLDTSVHNLSSIVLLVESDGKTMLLTGDGRGDHTLEGLEKTGVIAEGGKLHVNVLKLPHHGSVRNIDRSYFERITADHYIASANGRDGNPDLPTLKLISDVRSDDKFTIHFTHRPEEFIDKKIIDKIQKFFADEKAAGRKYKVHFREEDAPSIRIEL